MPAVQHGVPLKCLAVHPLRDTEMVDDALPVLKSGFDWDTVQGNPAEVPVVDNSGGHLCIAGFLKLHQVQDLQSMQCNKNFYVQK
jgi:hypothetical protein